MTRIALVTGATRGIGVEIARGLGAAGVTVLLGARDLDRGERWAQDLAADGVTAEAVQLDVTDDASVGAAAAWIDARFGRLDVLVNNAGIALDTLGPASATDVAVMRRTYETNVFGVVAVTNAMLPLLRRAPSARIVNVSSGLGSLTQTSGPDGAWSAYPLLAYASSKTAVNALTVQYANELRGTAITVNASDPGYCATDLNGHRGPRTPAQGAAVTVALALWGDGGPTGEFHDEAGPLPW